MHGTTFATDIDFSQVAIKIQIVLVNISHWYVTGCQGPSLRQQEGTRLDHAGYEHRGSLLFIVSSPDVFWKTWHSVYNCVCDLHGTMISSRLKHVSHDFLSKTWHFVDLLGITYIAQCSWYCDLRKIVPCYYFTFSYMVYFYCLTL